MIDAVCVIGPCVLFGIYMLYKMFTEDSRHYVSILTAVITLFGLAAAQWMMYLEFPKESVRPVLFGTLGVLGVLGPIGYVICYVKSTRRQKAELRGRLRLTLLGLLGQLGIILIVILVGWLYKMFYK